MPAARSRSLRIGCSGWNYASWKDEFYEGKPARLWLQHYARYFDTVEVNNTFYRLPLESSVARWVAETPRGLRLRDQGEPVPDAHQAADRSARRTRRATTSASSRSCARRSSAPSSGSCRRRSSATTTGSAPRSRRCRPDRHCFEFRHPTLVRGAGLRAAARAPRRARDRRPSGGEGVPDARADDRLDVRPLPLRVARPSRQLLRVRAGGMGQRFESWSRDVDV